MFGVDDAALAAVGGAALNFMGTQSTNEANKDIAASNNAWSAAQYASRYQTMSKDLRAAGLNPMLAYSQSPGTAPSAQQVTFQNPMASAVDAYQKSSERDLIAAQVKKTEADAKVSSEQAKLIAQQAIESKSRERAADTGANLDTYRLWSEQNVHNPTQKQLGAMYWSQMQVNQQTLPKIVQEIKTGGAHAAQAYAMAAKARTDKRIGDEEWQIVHQAAEYAKRTGMLSPALKDISSAAGAVRSLIPRPSTTVNKTYNIRK